MQTLTYLNGIGTSSVTFTDNRGTNVIFDRAAGKSYSFTETSLSFNLLVGANIVDIINPSSANVRYKINIGTTQATLNFGALPTGVTVSQAGTIYTVYGIDSISDWEAVKQPTVTIDPAFAGTFSYEAAVVYNTDTAADIEFEWTVGIYLPTAELASSASISTTPSYIRGGVSNLQSYFNLSTVGEKVLGAAFYFVTNAVKTAVGAANITSAATLYAKPKTYEFADSTLTIDNPYPAAGADFSKYIGLDNTGLYVIASIEDRSDYSAFAFSTGTGNTEFSFPRQETNGFGSVQLTTSDNFVVIIEENNTTNQDTIHLWKKQITGDLYTLIDSINAPTQSVAINVPNSMTDDYLMITDLTYNPQTAGANGRTWVYSLDATTGFTLEYTKTGTTFTYLGTNFGNVLGNSRAINNSWLALAEDTQTGASGNHSEIFVYDTATGTLQYTLNQTGTFSPDADSMILNGDELICLMSNGDLRSYDLTTGTQNYNTSLSGVTNVSFNYWMQYYDSTFVAVQGKLYNVTNGVEQSDLSLGSNTSDQFRFKSENILIDGDYQYTGTYSSEGRLQIRTET